MTATHTKKKFESKKSKNNLQAEPYYKMPTIKFSERQYKALLTILSYLENEKKHVCEEHDIELDDEDEKEQLRTMRAVEAFDHIYYDTLLVSLAVDGEDDDYDEDEKEDNSIKK
jgi:hypothetical protein